MKKDWEYGTLKDAVNKGSSNISLNKIKDEVGEYPVFKAKGFAQNVSFFHQEKEYLAIIKDGAGIGRVSKHPAKSSVVATMQYLIPKEEFDIGFVQYFLNGIDFQKHRKGSTIPHVYFKDYKNEAFPLLPLKEQQQIVAILDKAFAAIATVKDNAQQNLLNAKQLFESYLQNIFSTKGDDWEEKSLKDVTTKIGSGATPRGGKSSYKLEGISLIRSMNVHDFEFREKNLAFIDDDQADKLKNVIIQENDVLLNITGASIARCCIVPEKYLPARVNQHVSIIRANTDVIYPLFLGSLLTSKFYKDQILEIGEQGATRQAITKVQLENFKIVFPQEIVEQKNVIKKLNKLSAETKKLEVIYQQKIEDLEELKKSVLQKAFNGELTASSIKTTVNNTIAVIPNISTTDLHAGIIAIAFQSHIEKNKENTFHHVKSEKIIHLAETFVGIHLNRNPVKDAAGPNDFPLAKKVESRARKASFFTVRKQNGRYMYNQGSQFNKLIAKVKLVLNEKTEPLMNLLDLMVPMTTQQAEILATVYASWNNLIIENKTINNEAIVSEARENWHIEKMKIPREKFFKAITWMKSKGIVPTGNGKKIIAKAV